MRKHTYRLSMADVRERLARTFLDHLPRGNWLTVLTPEFDGMRLELTLIQEEPRPDASHPDSNREDTKT